VDSPARDPRPSSAERTSWCRRLETYCNALEFLQAEIPQTAEQIADCEVAVQAVRDMFGKIIGEGEEE
jgi:hypothetical protein